jgi:hypothetical protein
VRIAYENHRILVIHWTRPAPLQTFLVPPEGGLDWRVPSSFADVLEDKNNGRIFMTGNKVRTYAADSNITLLRTRLQTDKAGQVTYDSTMRLNDEPTFDQVFAPLWRIFFRPSEAVARKIIDFLGEHQLVPGQYVAAHLRASYFVASRPYPELRRLTEHAINCSTEIRPSHRIFFASDDSMAVEIAQTYVGGMGGSIVVHSPDPNPPLHIDLDRNWKHRKPTAYFDTFIDLYVIALAGCVAFSEGGFGHWGLLIGGNLTCQINAKTKPSGRFLNECQWHAGTSKKLSNQTTSGGEMYERASLFLEPMPDRRTEDIMVSSRNQR